MAEPSQQTSAQTLRQDMKISDHDIERRKKIVGLEPVDLQRIAALKHVVLENVDGYAEAFFQHLANLEEARGLLSSRAMLERARQLEREHLAALIDGNYDGRYVDQRLELGLLYGRAGLDTRVFLAAFHHLLKGIGNDVMRRFQQSPLEGFDNFMSLKKVAFFDIGIAIDALVFARERVIGQQQEAIRELSTPVLRIRDRLLLLPLIGVLDSHRAQLVTENLLHAIRQSRAKVAVMDVTGVATIDSRVANHLLQTVAAARLMGAVVIVTGLSADVAQSLVALGIDLTRLNTVGDLQGGVEEAEQMLGYRVVVPAADQRGQALQN